MALLLDTHTLLWLVAARPLRPEAVVAIGGAQRRNRLFVSPISAWEIGAGLGKKNPAQRPDLKDLPANVWFTRGVESLGLRVHPFTLKIAIEAASVPAVYGYGDPGDCIVIATARILKQTLVTRDERILALALSRPDYIRVIPC